MSIPSYQEFYPYILKLLSNNKTYKLKDARKEIGVSMNITEEQKKELLPSKVQTVFDNRVNWAFVYLRKAGVLGSPSRGKYYLTEVGERLIKEKGYDITDKNLLKFKSFREFKEPKSESKDNGNTIKVETKKDVTPDDQLVEAFKKIEDQLAEDLLSEISSMSPIFFERLVLDLLYGMGYGGKGDNRIIYTPATQDDGIDGLIKEDELGLEHIYVQAKRWSGTVGQPEIQKFSGALSGKGAKKGVFITTSSFSRQALEYAANHQVSRIVLIDGKKLADLMIAYGIGLYTENTYKIQKIDTDYFIEDI